MLTLLKIFDKHARYHITRQIFFEHQACLDGSAQSHFVAKHTAPTKTSQHDLSGAHLVIERDEFEQIEADQFAESAYQQGVFSLQAQAIKIAAGKAAFADSFHQKLCSRK